MRKVIISGGNGFVGSSLSSHLLKRGVEVHALVNANHQRLDEILPAENIHELEGDVSSAVEIVTRVQPDTIFHLAAVYAEPISAQCVLSMINGNLTLGASLLFAATQCRSQPVFVNTGTYWQFDEGARYAPNTLYAATKQAFQDLLHFYRSRALIRSTTLILYDTFGANDTRDKLWQRLTEAVPGAVFRLSPGEQTIHLVHIDDVVSAFLRAADLLHSPADLGPMYTVHSPAPRSLRSLVQELDRGAKLDLELRWGALPYWDGQVLQPWIGESLPGWTAEVSVPEALLDLAGRGRVIPMDRGEAHLHG